MNSRLRVRSMKTVLHTLLTIVALSVAWGAAQTTVVASIQPYFDLLRQIAGDRAAAVRLLPPGASPHRFDPGPGDVALLAGAELIVLNGGLDAWLENLIAASGSRAEVIVILEEIDLTPIAADEPGPRGSGGVNPHIWLDPLLMVRAVELLAERLGAHDPAGAEGYRANASRLRDDLLALDTELRATLAPVAGAPFVPFHDAWPYFAARYGLDLLVEIEPFPGREPSPAYLAEALALIAEAGATAVFNERQLNARPAQVVAESAGLALYTLDPLGGGEGVESYRAMLRYNAAVIADALGADADR